MSKTTTSGTLTVRELSTKTWSDFEEVMGKNGGASGCWCMHWRLSSAEFMEQKGEGNTKAMTGIAGAFLEAGFTEVARKRGGRPIMRRKLSGSG